MMLINGGQRHLQGIKWQCCRFSPPNTSSLPQASSSQVGHRLAMFCGLRGSSHLAEIYQSYNSTAGIQEPNNSSRPHGFGEVSELDDKGLGPAKHHKKHSLVDEPCQDSRFESKAVVYLMPERIMRSTCTPAMDDSLRSFPTHRDGNRLIGTATIKECSKDEDCGPLQGADAGKKQETLDTSAAECTPVVDLTPDDVVA
ncbi:UNVERIFIED_CONTAM: hypothetical protein Sangu_2089900 [Sesamum angustifolium]|uniref:Uncharacterized protein n=1 Tax=Sesamum angustifolium TaxID=2727405 RepID=A0AAW2LJ74_9LAMI